MLRILSAHYACLGCLGLLLAFTQSSHAQALAARGNIDLKGNDIASDRYDSSAPDYPGYWTNSIRKAGGDIVTDSSITNSFLSLGNAHIAGHVKSGPTGFLQFGPSSSVGDLAWVDSATPGIEPGWFANDVNVSFPDVSIPNVPWMVTGSLGGGGSGTAPNGKTYSHIFLNFANGGYYVLNDSGDIYVGTNVTVTVYVKNSVGTFAPTNLYVAGAGTNSGKLVAYIDATNVYLSTDWPQSSLPADLILLGTANCTSLSYRGNGDFMGVIYAPSADFQWAGGGSGVPLDVLGSFVAKSIQLNGHYHFHFDEALYKLSVPLLLFASPPQNCAAVIGQNTNLTVYTLGPGPLGYQWQFAGNSIPDPTNGFLSLTNIQATNAGLYQVIITNLSGAVTSQVQLAVYDSPTPTLQAPALSSNNQFQVSVAGVPGFNYALETSTDLTNWIRLTTNTSTYLFSDTNAASLTQCFYRAVYLP